MEKTNEKAKIKYNLNSLDHESIKGTYKARLNYKKHHLVA